MFTGIVEEVGTLKVREQCRLVFTAQKAIEEVAVGDSIAVNGACLTVTSIDHHNFSVDVMPETLHRTNLDGLKVGHKVNLERPLVFGGRVGGHLVQGHVDGTGWVKSIEPQGDARIMKIIAPPELMSFIVEKGFIAVD
ncbi:MAG: riboflavin synthase, partial [Dehalococcoidia bacterium]